MRAILCGSRQNRATPQFNPAGAYCSAVAVLCPLASVSPSPFATSLSAQGFPLATEKTVQISNGAATVKRAIISYHYDVLSLDN